MGRTWQKRDPKEPNSSNGVSEENTTTGSTPQFFKPILELVLSTHTAPKDKAGPELVSHLMSNLNHFLYGRLTFLFLTIFQT